MGRKLIRGFEYKGEVMTRQTKAMGLSLRRVLAGLLMILAFGAKARGQEATAPKETTLDATTLSRQEALAPAAALNPVLNPSTTPDFTTNPAFLTPDNLLTNSDMLKGVLDGTTKFFNGIAPGVSPEGPTSP